MKNVLIVSNTFSKDEGGATGIAFGQSRALKEKGVDISVFAGNFKDYDLGFKEEGGIKIFKIKIKNTKRYMFRSWLAMRNWRVEKEFKNFLKDKNFDVIHFHNLYYQMPFSLMKIAKKNCNKVFFTAHDVMTFSPQKLSFFVNKRWNLENIDEINYKFSWWRHLKQEKKAFNPLRNFYIRQCLKKCNKIFCVSQELEKALNQNKILNTVTIHNGIDVKDWGANEEEVNKLRQELDLENKKVLLFAGRLSGAKGGQVVLKLIKKVKKEIPNICLLLLGGDDEYIKNTKKQVLNLGIADNIVLLNKVSRLEMKNYYSLADLTVVPSICFDSFPTIILESFACGTPVVATIFGGSREIIKNQKNGFLINPLDIDDFSNNVISFLKNRNLQVGADDLKEFIKEKWVEKIMSFYK